MALYLTCGLCGRKQADGLLSRGHWGHLEETPHGTLLRVPDLQGVDFRLEGAARPGDDGLTAVRGRDRLAIVAALVALL